ncbi:MAG: type II secretion system F family protein [Acidimicrobiales bacterium]
MTLLLLLVGVLLWSGLALMFSGLRWFNRQPLTERLRPYAPVGAGAPARAGLVSASSFREMVGPLAQSIGDRAARLFGVNEELAVRLERIHSPLDVTAFRVRELGWAVVGFAVGTLLAAAAGLATILVVVGALAGPLIAFVAVEADLGAKSRDWQRRLFLELPVVSEQLGMLLSAGYSLGAALNRLAARGNGTCSRDLARVGGRIRQGLAEADALREWAEVADVDAVHKLVGVLALNRDTADLGRLIGDEARAIRQEVHRNNIEIIERRSQQVWIPVTVATLVPGVIFLTIPFIEAIRLFAGTG